MNEILLGLNPSYLFTTITVSVIGLLSGSMLAFSQWMIYRRRLATAFLLSVVLLLAYYVWAAATLDVNSRAGIYYLPSYHLEWFVLVCLALGLPLLWSDYWFETLPIYVALSFSIFLSATDVCVCVYIFIQITLTAWLLTQALSEWFSLRSRLSRFTVKHALDMLELGVIFADPNGRIQLMNSTMTSVIDGLNLKHNVKIDPLIEEVSQKGRLTSTPEGTVQEGYVTLRVVDVKGSTWMFTRRLIDHRGGVWTQITATDVSNHMALSKTLEREIEDLQERQAQFDTWTKKLDEEFMRQLILRTRAQIHDTLAQRISFVHRFLEDDVSDCNKLAQLRELLADLPSDLGPEAVSRTPEARIEAFREIIGMTGLNVNVEGEFPEGNEQAEVFITVLREGITNVLLHASAPSMNVIFEEDKHGYKLIMSNPSSSQEVEFNQGLRGLRNLLSAHGGYLRVSGGETFTVEAWVPAVPFGAYTK